MLKRGKPVPFFCSQKMDLVELLSGTITKAFETVWGSTFDKVSL